MKKTFALVKIRETIKITINMSNYTKRGSTGWNSLCRVKGGTEGRREGGGQVKGRGSALREAENGRVRGREGQFKGKGRSR